MAGLKEELARKTFHLLMFVVLGIYVFSRELLSRQAALFLLTCILVLLIVSEYFRLELRTRLPIVSWFWKLRRKKERNRLGADVFFMLGAIICFAVFDDKVAIAAILMATFGDMAAALIGRFGKIRVFRERMLEGILAELVVNLAVGLFVLPWPIIIVMALVATAVEIISTKIDDNLLIPLFSGLTGQVMLWLL